MRAKIYRASAGSGKTYRLAYKFVHDTIKHYTEKPYLYRAILAVTFTNKATEEMKSRIILRFSELANNPNRSEYLRDLQRDLGLSVQEINKRAKAILTKILHDYSRFTILTIDKFFQRILRAFIKELGLDLNYNIELDSSTILARSTDSLIDEIATDQELQQWIMAFTQENIDDEGKWDIRSQLLNLGKEIFKEGSKQSIEESVPKEKLLEIINQASAKLAKQKAQIVEIGTKAMEIMHRYDVEPIDFKGASRSFAKIFPNIADGNIPSEINTTTRRNALSTDDWVKIQKRADVKQDAAMAAAVELQPLLAEICDFHESFMRRQNSLSLIKETYRSYALLQDIHKKVGAICQEQSVMLLSETKYILSRFIADNDTPFIYEKTGNRFERFMIDEFQDTSAQEWANFVPLLQNAMAQTEDNSVLIVGDIKQSIYRWRGGDWKILQQGVGASLGNENTKVIDIKENYRSLPEIVKFNNMTIENVVLRDNKNTNSILLDAHNSGNLTQRSYNTLCDTIGKAYEGHTQIPQIKSSKQGYVKIERFTDQPPLEECIQSIIERGYSYGDIMILHRTGKDAAKSAEILLEYKQRNNEFNIMTQDSLIIGKAPISNFIIALMSLSQNQDDSISRAIVNDYLHRPYDTLLSEEEQQELTRISQLTPEKAFEQIVSQYGLSSHTDEIAYLQAIHEQITAFCTSKVADIQLFLKYWAETGQSKALSVEMSGSTIELTTIHKSKGLERKVIIIPYCNWPLDPKTSSIKSSQPGALNIVWATPSTADSDLAKIGRFPVNFKKDMSNSIYSDDYYREMVYSHVDSINMLYVALTRARESLYIFIPDKSINDSGRERKSDNIGNLLWESVKPGSSEILSKIEFGTPCKIEATDSWSQDSDNSKELNILIDQYPTCTSEVKLSLPSQRYFEEQRAGISSQRLGIKMHEILSEATDAESINTRIKECVDSGEIAQTQAQELADRIEQEFNNPLVKEWFSDGWDMVRCENDIICKQTIGTRRPDRVMINGEHAVVVDYKFGAEKTKSHQKQLREYMSLLKEMGYTQVEGYIWYMTLSQIEKIEQ